LKHGLRQGLSAEATLFVAFMLAIQVLFSGLSLGARAAAADAGAFSHILCSVDGPRIAADAPTDGQPSSHFIDCCTFGCSLAGGAAPVAPDDDIALLNRRLTGTKPAPVLSFPALHAERKPQNPRAPPARI